MNAPVLPFLRRIRLVAPAGLLLAGLPLCGADAASQIDAFPTFQSYIKITGQAPSITGDKAAFQARTRQSENGGTCPLMRAASLVTPRQGRERRWSQLS